ncbi:hypothetical protein LZ554_000463 [Drepanopeziza brunnea f. sp. 'monogermtubi']|nr:hypothetical protein LZ554_000463 [Drepanopeziza brunnea f. sp. 'monogermtubi']
MPRRAGGNDKQADKHAAKPVTGSSFDTIAPSLPAASRKSKAAKLVENESEGSGHPSPKTTTAPKTAKAAENQLKHERAMKDKALKKAQEIEAKKADDRALAQGIAMARKEKADLEKQRQQEKLKQQQQEQKEELKQQQQQQKALEAKRYIEEQAKIAEWEKIKKRFDIELSDEGNLKKIRELDAREAVRKCLGLDTEDAETEEGAPSFDHSLPWPPFEVRPSPTHGTGIFATRFIKAGTEFLRENATMKGSCRHFAQEALFKVLPAEKQASILTLHSACSCDDPVQCKETPLRKILISNTFQVSYAAPRDEYLGPFIYELAGRFNHSCTPNAARGFSDVGELVVLRAFVDIQEGEEINIEYFSGGGTTAARRQHLYKQYRFTCACRACIAGLSTRTDDGYKVFLESTRSTTSPTLNTRTAEESAIHKEVDEWYRMVAAQIKRNQVSLTMYFRKMELDGTSSPARRQLELDECLEATMAYVRGVNRYGVGVDALAACEAEVKAMLDELAAKLTPEILEAAEVLFSGMQL